MNINLFFLICLLHKNVDLIWVVELFMKVEKVKINPILLSISNSLFIHLCSWFSVEWLVWRCHSSSLFSNLSQPPLASIPHSYAAVVSLLLLLSPPPPLLHLLHLHLLSLTTLLLTPILLLTTSLPSLFSKPFSAFRSSHSTFSKSSYFLPIFQFK